MSRTKKTDVKGLQAGLLGWFDRHRRIMPWRAAKGKRANPYHVWLSEIMLQQTTVVTVGPYFMKFIGLWPTVGDLAAAKLDDVLTAWAGLGYYARARNLHKCAQAVTSLHGGKFPADEQTLLELPGIGPYTAAAIASIAFDRPAVAVDGNVERVVSRFLNIEEPLPLSKPSIRDGAAMLAAGNPRPGDFTQAFMELGATVCTPRKPRCGLCPWQQDCKARKAGNAEELPRKLPKKAKPAKFGKVYWITNAKGQVMIQKRTDKGLYEGMYQLPTTTWLTDKKAAAGLGLDFLQDKGAKALGASVKHSFTHFDLNLEIWQYSGRATKLPAGGVWVYPDELGGYALPSLMQKAVRLAAGAAG
ncbi:MAG TPA: A/G-specific adenine glycosylase [Alphaproteobacteria bacterium]|nr:A/G-specific adenine glycosylase [Alphaproteobacteria bacterium]